MNTTKDIEKLRKKFKLLNKELSKNLIIRNRFMANKIRNKARQGAKGKTKSSSGRMAAAIISMKVGKQKLGSKFRIISKKPQGSRWPEGYNVLQEYGIRANTKYGFNPAIGKMQELDTPWGQHFISIGLIKGNHPGAPAKHFMHKAFKWAEKKYPKSMKREVNKTIKKVIGGK